MDRLSGWDDLRAQVESNQRLRWGLWVVFGILLFYVCLILYDTQAELESEYMGLLSRVSDLQEVRDQSFWRRRSDLTGILRHQIDGEFWQSSSKGLAQASFQTWLEQQLASVHLSDARIQMLPVESRNDVIPLWKVTARVQSVFNPKELQRLLYKLESHEQLVLVDELVIFNNNKGAVDFQATAWFRGR